MIRLEASAQALTLIPVGIEVTVTEERGGISHKGETGYFSGGEVNLVWPIILPVFNFVRFAVLTDLSQIDFNL